MNSKSVEAHIQSVFRIFVSVVFVLQKITELIFANLKRFESICVSLNSTGICRSNIGVQLLYVLASTSTGSGTCTVPVRVSNLYLRYK